MRTRALDAGGPVPIVGERCMLGQEQPVRQQPYRGPVARGHEPTVAREAAEQPIIFEPLQIAIVGKNEVDRDVSGRLTLRMPRSEEHTSELQSLMRISYAVFCLKQKTKKTPTSLLTQSIKVKTTQIIHRDR